MLHHRLDGGAFLLGYIFEQVIYSSFLSKQISYSPDVKKADSGDFEMTLKNGLRVVVDAKCASSSKHNMLMVPVKDGQSYHVYIAGRFIDTGRAEIVGWCTPDELKPQSSMPGLPFRTSTAWLELQSLRPIESLMALVQDGKAAEKYPASVVNRFRVEVMTI